MGNTENHNWTTPEQGSNTYPEDFERFFEEADTDVEIRDEDSNKGQYTPKAGAKFKAEDKGNVYIGDGSTWNKIESSGDNPSFEKVSAGKVNNVFHSLQQSGTNGSDKIQAALNKADSTAGINKVVVSGDGPDDLSGISAAKQDRGYLLTSSLEIGDDTILQIDSYLFLDAGVDDNPIRNNAAYSGDSTRNSNIHIRGSGHVDGNASNQTFGSSDTPRENGIDLHKVDGFSVSGLTIGPVASYAIAPEDTTDWYISNVTIDQDGTTDNQDGCNIGGPSYRGRIDGIEGQCGDSMVTIATAGTKSSHKDETEGGEIEHLHISGIVSEDVGGNGRPVDFYGGGGAIMRNVTVDGVTAENVQTKGVRFLKGNDSGQADALRNITLSNADIEITNGSTALKVTTAIRGLTLRNVDIRGDPDTYYYQNGARVDSLRIDGGLYETTNTNPVGAINIDGKLRNSTIDGTTIRYAETTADRHAIGFAGGANLTDVDIDVHIFRAEVGLFVDANATIGGAVDVEFHEFQIGNLYEGLQPGIVVNGNGEEAAGSGNTPSASNWTKGDKVENTDDGTLWQLLNDGATWTQLA